MVVDLTVAIPTYNGARRLPEVLDRLQLAGQEAVRVTPDSEPTPQINHSQTFSWEVLVVDNNSSDDTAQVVQSYQANWPLPYPLRYCFEPQQGAAFARRRAFHEDIG